MPTSTTTPRCPVTSGAAPAAPGPAPTPSKRFDPLTMTIEALRKGLKYEDGICDRLGGHDISRFRIGARRYAAVTHPDYVEHILYKHVDNYWKGIDYEPLSGVMGPSIFTDDGESWRRHRMLLNPMFGRRHLKTVYDLMVEPVRAAVDALPQGSSEIELGEQMVDLTLAVIGNALFNETFEDRFPDGIAGMISDGLGKATWFQRALLVAQPPALATELWWKVFHSRVPIPPPISDVRAHGRNITAAVESVLADRAANPTDTPDLLNLMLAARDEQGAMTPQRTVSEAMLAMLAGHETTANAMEWTWYLLAQNPDARDRLLEEVDLVLEGRTPTLDDLAALPWATACFEEAMRLYPPVFMVSRVAVEDDVISGHHIKAGTTVWIPAYAIHRDPRWWPDPERFDPSRFLPGAEAGRPRSAYVPFVGGRRVCIGRSFAMIEGVLILAMFSQTHTFDLIPGRTVEPEMAFTLRPRGGLRMIARPRNSETTI